MKKMLWLWTCLLFTGVTTEAQYVVRPLTQPSNPPDDRLYVKVVAVNGKEVNLPANRPLRCKNSGRGEKKLPPQPSSANLECKNQTTQ
jgi:hypothetical protein